jgi:hypothetical protein
VVKIKYVVIAGVVLATGIIAFVIFSQTEEAKVKKQFIVLAEKVKKQRKKPCLSLPQRQIA